MQSFYDTALTAGTAYYYEVRAINGGMSSDFTSVASDTTVSGLRVIEVASDHTELAWTNNLDGASAIQVARSDDGGQTLNVIDTVDPSANTYEDWSVQSNQTYIYRLLAVTAGGPTVELNDEPATTPAPSVADISTTMVTTQEIDLSFEVDDATATAIEIDRSSDGLHFVPLTTSLPIDTTDYQDVGLTPGTPYWYRVCAIDPSGRQAFSDVSTWTLSQEPQAGSDDTATAGQLFTGVVADFPTMLGDSDLSNYGAFVSWGNGTSSFGTVTADGTGGFEVTASNLYAAPGENMTDVCVYDSLGDNAEAFGSVTVIDSAPTVETPATATLSGDGTTADLSVLGADAAGEEDLTYTWTVVGTPPAAVTFDSNASNDAKDTTATFSAVGTYNFEVAVQNSEGGNDDERCQPDGQSS